MKNKWSSYIPREKGFVIFFIIAIVVSLFTIIAVKAGPSFSKGVHEWLNSSNKYATNETNTEQQPAKNSDQDIVINNPEPLKLEIVGRTANIKPKHGVITIRLYPNVLFIRNYVEAYSMDINGKEFEFTIPMKNAYVYKDYSLKDENLITITDSKTIVSYKSYCNNIQAYFTQKWQDISISIALNPEIYDFMYMNGS